MRMRRTAGMLVAMLVAVTGFAVTSAPTATAESCSALLVVGLRGSGESYDGATSGMGTEVYAAYQQIATLVPGTRPFGLPYEAVSIFPLSNLGSAYWQSVAVGSIMLANYLSQEETACPFQRIALIGYSQGAEVIGDVLSTLPAAQRSLVAQVLYFGDPRFNPAIPSVDRGTYDTRLSGFVGSRTLAALWRPKLRSYCLAHDPVCGFSNANVLACVVPSLCAHYRYQTNGYSALGGMKAGIAIRALPLLGPPPPPPPPPSVYVHHVYHTCANGACGLNARTGPGYTNFGITRVLVDGSEVDIVCQTTGEAVLGIDGSSSNVWDKLADGDYVADFYVDTPGMTGSFSPPIPQC